MVALENEAEKISGSCGNGVGGRPPFTGERTPDEFGHHDDWEQWEGELNVSELDLASAVLRHPASKGANEAEITKALLNDDWREKHRKMKDAFQSMRLLEGKVVYLDSLPHFSRYDEFPPSIA